MRSNERIFRYPVKTNRLNFSPDKTGRNVLSENWWRLDREICSFFFIRFFDSIRFDLSVYEERKKKSNYFCTICEAKSSILLLRTWSNFFHQDICVSFELVDKNDSITKLSRFISNLRRYFFSDRSKWNIVLGRLASMFRLGVSHGHFMAKLCWSL